MIFKKQRTAKLTHIKNLVFMILVFWGFGSLSAQELKDLTREKIAINNGWKFFKYASLAEADSLIYDVRPEVKDTKDDKPADSKPTEAVAVKSDKFTLKAYILPSGNAFINNPSKHFKRPSGNPGKDFPFVQTDFDDSKWESLNLPHDWAIKGPFYEGWEAEVGGGMGRLPSPGVAWYRRKIAMTKADEGKKITLELEGAMSYAMVWLNGNLVGGWPHGYTTFQLDLTPYLKVGKENQLAIRIDNPNYSSRWYPGGGIYRNVWLIKTNPIHVKQWGTYVKTKDVSLASAKVSIATSLINETKKATKVAISTAIYLLDKNDKRASVPTLIIENETVKLLSGESKTLNQEVEIKNPKLWGPAPSQQPNRYVAVTNIFKNDKLIDSYETKFGIRELNFDPVNGLFVNKKHVYIKGVNQHHDLGALGAAFNVRAAERQLEILQDLGCNAIRMSHNPPAPELLELTDKMGFLVINEIYDGWERKKNPHDFHLIYEDWHEQDLRALIRRDRNNPSVIVWSFGNEVGEQYTGDMGALVAKKLNAIVKEEDETRPTTVSMNYAKPDMPLPAVVDLISLNYQGEGIRFGPGYEGLKGITTPPLFPKFHAKFPDKMILSTENAATLSSRGDYFFPVVPTNSAPAKDGQGEDPIAKKVSSYELYTVEFGASPDKVFKTLDEHPFVAGGFVWSGFDYLGEPTPYYLARSSYFGIVDLAGFKKDRYYLYQSRWRPDFPMAHILPHWNWENRLEKITPVHVFTSGDEAELFLNGKSLGKKKKADFEYRLRWDNVVYEPGELKVVAYKNGEKWASDIVKTSGKAARLNLSADHLQIKADGKDLTFITLRIEDENGVFVPNANQEIKFEIEGAGEIIATDNGDPTSLVSFASPTKQAYNGLCLVIVRSLIGKAGEIKVTATVKGMQPESIRIISKL